jgi:hypothetical protein
MISDGWMREILLHGGANEAFDQSVIVARQLANSIQARLHVVYTVEDPLAAGWTAEMGVERLPEIHQAMIAEARTRLAALIPIEDQDRLGVEIVLRTGLAADELVRYTTETSIDIAVVQASWEGASSEIALALVDRGRCAVLVLR